MKKFRLVAILLTMILTMGTLLTGCGDKIDSDATLVTINGGEDTITLGYGNFVAHYTQAAYEKYYMDYYGTGMWEEDLFGSGNTAEQDLKDNILEQLETQYLLRQHAADYGVELSEDDTAAIEEAADQFIADNTEEALEQMGATGDYAIELMTNETYAVRVQDKIYAEADVTITDEDIEEAGDDYDEATLIEEKQSEYYDSVIDGWKEEITWEVDEDQWAKVNFDYHYTAPETEEETADTTETTETTDTTETTETEVTEETDTTETSETTDTTDTAETTDTQNTTEEETAE